MKNKLKENIWQEIADLEPEKMENVMQNALKRHNLASM